MKKYNLFRISRIAVVFFTLLFSALSGYSQHQVKEMNLIGERHLEVLRILRRDPEFEKTWHRCINLKNELLDSITFTNPEENIFIEAPASFEYFYQSYLKSGVWSSKFLPGNIYDKAWIEYLYGKGRTKVQVHAIDLELKQNTETVITAILGTALKPTDIEDLYDGDKVFKILDNLDQSDPIMPFLYNIAEIGFGNNLFKKRRLRKAFNGSKKFLTSVTNVLDSEDLDYMSEVVNSYLKGYKIRMLSDERLKIRDALFLEKIEKVNSHGTFITGVSHVTKNDLIPVNIKSMLETAGWKVNVYLVE